MERLLYRPSEAAELLGIGRSKIYAMLAAGEIPVVRLGKSVRVPAAALRRWVSERGSNTSDEAPDPERA